MNYKRMHRKQYRSVRQLTVLLWDGNEWPLRCAPHLGALYFECFPWKCQGPIWGQWASSAAWQGVCEPGPWLAWGPVSLWLSTHSGELPWGTPDFVTVGPVAPSWFCKGVLASRLLPLINSIFLSLDRVTRGCQIALRADGGDSHSY